MDRQQIKHCNGQKEREIQGVEEFSPVAYEQKNVTTPGESA